jgi:molybdopterin converting factor subunit 1
MELNILAFGIAKQIVGSRCITMNMNAPSVGSLMHELEQQYPDLRKLSCYRIAVNQEYADMDHELKDQDEVAIIPPVSGG